MRLFRFFKHPFALGAVFVFVLALGLFGPTHLTFADFDITNAPGTELALLMGWITTIINAITATLGNLTLKVIEALVVPILQYNSFSSSDIITRGWSLVRDVVNMFVVIVLLVIAVATIVGYKKVAWEQALPQFLLAVILVNFSRTICGLLIDVSQVIMFTFVNALLDVAAGNFANMFHMQDFFEYSLTALYELDGTASPLTAAQQMGAAYVSFVLFAAIFAIVFLLALVYLWRIVLLWVLVIMSPLTFFLGGLGGLFKFAEGASGEWWKKFTACLVLGPMLTFFLWLALASASGDIVQDEHFPTPSSEVAVTLKAFESGPLIGSLLGLILLVVGMQQSASFASTMGGVAKDYINEKTGTALVKGIATRPLKEGFRQADRRLGASVGVSSLSAQLASDAGNMGKRAGANWPTLLGGSYVGAAVGRTAANLTGAAQRPIEAQILAEKKAAKERVSKYTDDQLVQHVSLMAAGKTSALGLGTRDDIEAIKVKALTDGDFRKKLKKDIGATNYDKLMEQALAMSEGDFKAAGGDMDKRNKALSQNVHLLKKDQDKFIQSDKFDARSMSEEAAANVAVRESLRKKYIRTDNNGRDIFADDELTKGAYGESLRLAAAGAGLLPSVYDAKTAQEKVIKGDVGVNALRGSQIYKPEAIAASVLAGRIKLSNLSMKDFDDNNGDSLTMGLLQASTAPSRIGDTKTPGADGRAVQEEYLRRANELQRAGKLDVTQTLQVDIANLAAGKKSADMFFDATDVGGSTMLTNPKLGRIERVLERDPSLVSRFKDIVGTDADVAGTVLNSIKVDEIKRMTAEFKSSINPEIKKKISENLATVVQAYDKFLSDPSRKLSKGDKNTHKIVTKSAGIMGIKKPRGIDYSDADDGGTTTT